LAQGPKTQMKGSSLPQQFPRGASFRWAKDRFSFRGLARRKALRIGATGYDQPRNGLHTALGRGPTHLLMITPWELGIEPALTFQRSFSWRGFDVLQSVTGVYEKAACARDRRKGASDPTLFAAPPLFFRASPAGRGNPVAAGIVPGSRRASPDRAGGASGRAREDAGGDSRQDRRAQHAGLDDARTHEGHAEDVGLDLQSRV
jgi:hypothetical protein